MYFDTKTNHHRFSSQRTKNESKRNGTNRNRIERREKRILAVAQSFSLITYCFIEFGQTKALTTMTTIMMENREKQRRGRRTEQRRGEKKKESLASVMIYAFDFLSLCRSRADPLFLCTICIEMGVR